MQRNMPAPGRLILDLHPHSHHRVAHCRLNPARRCLLQSKRQASRPSKGNFGPARRKEFELCVRRTISPRYLPTGGATLHPPLSTRPAAWRHAPLPETTTVSGSNCAATRPVIFASAKTLPKLFSPTEPSKGSAFTLSPPKPTSPPSSCAALSRQAQIRSVRCAVCCVPSTLNQPHCQPRKANDDRARRPIAVSLDHWRKLARTTRRDADRVGHEIRTLAAAMENAIEDAWPNVEPVRRAGLISLVRRNVVF